jgi:hypothetical protein
MPTTGPSRQHTRYDGRRTSPASSRHSCPPMERACRSPRIARVSWTIRNSDAVATAYSCSRGGSRGELVVEVAPVSSRRGGRWADRRGGAASPRGSRSARSGWARTRWSGSRWAAFVCRLAQEEKWGTPPSLVADLHRFTGELRCFHAQATPTGTCRACAGGCIGATGSRLVLEPCGGSAWRLSARCLRRWWPLRPAARISSPRSTRPACRLHTGWRLSTRRPVPLRRCRRGSTFRRRASSIPR